MERLGGMAVVVATGEVVAVMPVEIKVGVDSDLVNSAILALVKRPKNPVAGILYFFWKFINAFRVKGPKKMLSLPREPGPEAATMKPCEFKNC